MASVAATEIANLIGSGTDLDVQQPLVDQLAPRRAVGRLDGRAIAEHLSVDISYVA